MFAVVSMVTSVLLLAVMLYHSIKDTKADKLLQPVVCYVVFFLLCYTFPLLFFFITPKISDILAKVINNSHFSNQICLKPTYKTCLMD